jgi:glutamate-ammonia-ligase adenylyltransferase
VTDEHTWVLFLSGQMSSEEIEALLAPVGFADWRAAHRYLSLTATDAQQRRLLADMLPHLLLTLSTVADPDRVLLNLERLARGVPDPAAFLRHLSRNPRALENLATLFAGSQFLTDILLRNPAYFDQLIDPKRLARIRTVGQLRVEAQAAVAACGEAAEQLDALRHFQRRELLRIGVCDLLDLFDMSTATLQLSNLADSMIQVCLTLASRQTGIASSGFAVIALGKLGGEELNYSSDIDLLFLATPEAAKFLPLGKRLIDALTRITSEGFLYRVDMRLRPWGQTGALVSSVEGYLTYLAKHARTWEKQALLKARVVAGDEMVGLDFLERIQPALFDMQHVDIRAEVHAMKQQTEAHLRGQGRAWGEVKLGEGSIRDIEFVAQFLQLVHGKQKPEIRSRSTLDALNRLSSAGLLAADDYRVLADGYVLLRTIEHHLQMMHYRQTYTLPADPEALDQLARRLRFQGPDAREKFLARYQQHCTAIRAVYLKHLGSDARGTTPPLSQPVSPKVLRHLARLDASYSSAFGPEEIQRHAVLADQLDDDDHPVEVDATQLDDGRWRITVIAYDYPGELSLICGLLFAYGFSIDDGNAFTYQPQSSAAETIGETNRQKIVDVFAVEPVREDIEADVWTHYAADLSRFLRMTQAGQRREARGELAKQVVAALRERKAGTPSTLYPVDVEIDNTSSEQYTVLTIDAVDTPGFLYELTNALAISRVYIARVTVASAGQRVNDALLVTDDEGRKITDPGKIRELRSAIVLIKHFTHLLPLSSNPETALLHFRELIGQLFSRPHWPDELTSLDSPEVLGALARVLGVSEFLWDDFLRMQYANLFPVVKNVAALAESKSREVFQAEWSAVFTDLKRRDDEAWRDALNAFKDREMFRTDMRYILGYTEDFSQFSKELTDLVEVVIEAVTDLCADEQRAVFGSPLLDDGNPCPLSVFALGKCGGRELGFASDIELLFLYGGSGKTSGKRPILAAEFYEKVVETVLDAIRARREGIFQIDLQLRPYGKAGAMAVSIDSFSRYFAPGGPAWDYERQALVKLRPIAGDPGLGRRVLSLRDEYVYTGEPFNTTAMRAMRERQIRHLVTGGMLNIKFSPGGLVDVEYLVQGLQITYGHRDAALRSPNTLQAMTALAAAGILSEEDRKGLSEAYLFLRLVINAMRMVRGNAKDLTVPPEGSEEFAFLARRVGYGSTARLREDLLRHVSAVQSLASRLLP